MERINFAPQIKQLNLRDVVCFVSWHFRPELTEWWLSWLEQVGSEGFGTIPERLRWGQRSHSCCPGSYLSSQPLASALCKDFGRQWVLACPGGGCTFSWNFSGNWHTRLLTWEQFIAKVLFLREKKQLLESLNEGKSRPHLEVIAASQGPAAFAVSHRLTTGHWCQFRSFPDLSFPGRKLPTNVKSH